MTADRMILIATLAIGLSACGSIEPAPSAPGVTEPSPSDGLTRANSCPTIDLRSPSGTRVELTGTWRADTPATATQEGAIAAPVVRFVRQFGECVWWEEMDAFPGEPLAQEYRRLFFGSLGSDFNIVGQFGEVYTAGGAFDPTGESRFQLFGAAVWRVEFTTPNDEELVTLVGPSRDTNSLTGTFDTWVFSPIDSSTEAR